MWTRFHALLAGVSVWAAVAVAWAAPPIVDVTAIVDHPALNAVRDGLVDGLARAGYHDGSEIKIVFENAQGQPATAAQIARQFVGSNPAVIVALSTPSAQAAVAASRSIPIVFGAVTDPVAAKLVASIEHPGGNVTGVSDMSPLSEQLAILTEIVPNARRIGVIYNPGEPNSISSVADIKRTAAAKNITIVEAPVTRSADVRAAANSFAGRVDGIFAPADNTIASAFQALVESAQAAHLPLVTANTDQVALGAVASLGFNYRTVGELTADLVSQVLKGTKPGDIPVAFPKELELYVNKDAAKKTGIALPPSMLSRAAKTFG